MDELLQKLLEAEVLSEETKKELEEAFKGKLEEAMNEAKTRAAADVRAELTEQFITERDRLVEAVDTKVGEFLEAEITELKEDIESFRDLEAEYAEKLVEAKANMSVELKKDLGELVEKLDTFLEIRLAAELEELREDVGEIRKVEFGRRIFEAFAHEFINNYADEDSAEASLRETQATVAELSKALEESQRKTATLQRQVKLESVLEPLAGRQREVMEAILKNVDTDKLEEAYKTFIGRVIRESTDVAGSEKEGKVLAEGASKEDKKAAAPLAEKLKEAVVATGDDEEGLVKENAMSDDQKQHLAHLRRLAGIK
jgi:hypothetical protein